MKEPRQKYKVQRRGIFSFLECFAMTVKEGWEEMGKDAVASWINILISWPWLKLCFREGALLEGLSPWGCKLPPGKRSLLLKFDVHQEPVWQTGVKSALRQDLWMCPTCKFSLVLKLPSDRQLPRTDQHITVSWATPEHQHPQEHMSLLPELSCYGCTARKERDLQSPGVKHL